MNKKFLDSRNKAVTHVKWMILAAFGYFLLHPVAGIYEKSDYKDIIFMMSFMAGVMGLDVPLAFLRRKAWEKEVDEALHTEPPKSV